jgi:methylenetetrahydrofolate dehydrogenase (NADP+)/methenyltetrahydrofolate cyclohydrolase
MTAFIIDGKEYASNLRRRIKTAAEEFQKRRGVPIGLTVVLVGNDPAS